MSGTQPTQSHHIEALVLAFRHSRAKALVGTDALRTVISGQYRDMLNGDSFELESLWALLESQPGFNEADVKPPLCRFKTWEGDLDVGVVLPPQLGELSTLEIRALADECPVPAKELDRLLERGAFSKGEREARVAKWTDESVSEVATQMTAPPARRPWLLAVLTALALMGFGVAGYFVYDGLRPAATSTVSPSFFTGIPVKKATRAGFDVKVTELTDEAWFSLPQDQREAGLRSTITELARDGIRALTISDRSGKIRAIVQTYGPEQTRIRISFP